MVVTRMTDLIPALDDLIRVLRGAPVEQVMWSVEYLAHNLVSSA